VQQVQFDSFGERLPAGDVQAPGAQRGAPRWIVRGTVGFFWLLVVAVVVARVIYAAPAS
jgi:hypothetical protein